MPYFVQTWKHFLLLFPSINSPVYKTTWYAINFTMFKGKTNRFEIRQYHNDACLAYICQGLEFTKQNIELTFKHRNKEKLVLQGFSLFYYTTMRCCYHISYCEICICGRNKQCPDFTL